VDIKEIMCEDVKSGHVALVNTPVNLRAAICFLRRILPHGLRTPYPEHQ